MKRGKAVLKCYYSGEVAVTVGNNRAVIILEAISFSSLGNEGSVNISLRGPGRQYTGSLDGHHHRRGRGAPVSPKILLKPKRKRYTGNA